MAQPIPFELTYHVAAPPERLWPILADTDRLNRRIGLPATTRHALPGGVVSRALIRARLFGVVLEWEEQPFRFVEADHYWVQRRMTRGPLQEFNGGIRLIPTAAGTEVQVRSEFVTGSVAGRAIVRAMCEKTRREFDAMIAGVESHLQAREPTPFGAGVDVAPPGEAAAARGRLQAADAAWRRLPDAQRLCDHLASAGDAHLARIRPFVLAREWGVNRSEVLRLCLHATRVGVLDMAWELLCPNCLGPGSRWEHLDQVEQRSHCDSCRISYDANFDRAVEVTFRPNRRYREVEAVTYCSGGPRQTPHVVVQWVLDAGESAELSPCLTPGRYRLRNLTADLATHIYVEPGVPAAGIAATLEEDHLALGDPEGRVAPGRITLALVNRTGEPQQVILERLASYEDAATAAVVSVHQEFRDLFSSEALAPSVELGIQTLPLMFTDLKGSTALYRRLGDAGAYALVRDHFDLLRSLVMRHGGGVVKTIGDAVMAAFPTGRDALACALEIHAAVAQFNGGGREPVSLKVGLHQGPCIAARSYDDRLDYFGSTVNLAARTHEESRGDDIVITEGFLADPQAARLLAEAHLEPYEAHLRGIGEVRLYRVRARSAEAAPPA